MKKIILTLSVIALAIAAPAQSSKAKAVLDKTSAVIRNAGDIKADFSANATSGSMSGTIYIHKNMLHLTSSNAKCWFDGKTLWTYRKNTNEVNITTPTAAEKQSINPYQFINMYKKGYTYTMRETTLRGKATYEVTLNATSPTNKLRKMVINIDKATYYPVSVNMQRVKGITTIYITSCKTKQKFNPKTFSFNSSDYPSAEIIDLR